MSSSSTASLAAAQLGKRLHEPQHAVRVLPAVLTNAGQIALDVAGVVRRAIEGRVSSWMSRVASSHQVVARRRHRPSGACGRAAPENTAQAWTSASIWHSSFVRCQRRAVVEIGAAIPFAVPAMFDDRARVAASDAARSRCRGAPSGVLARSGSIRRARVEEEASHTLSPLPPARRGSCRRSNRRNR